MNLDVGQPGDNPEPPQPAAAIEPDEAPPPHSDDEEAASGHESDEIKALSPAHGWWKLPWLGVALFSLFWVFFPEPTDLIPIIGWLDEGVALIIFATALQKLGLKLPWLHTLLAFFLRRKKKGRRRSSHSRP